MINDMQRLWKWRLFLKEYWPAIKFETLRVLESPLYEINVPLYTSFVQEERSTPDTANFQVETILLQQFYIDDGEIVWVGYGPQSNVLAFHID